MSLKATTKRKQGDALDRLKKRLDAFKNKEVAIGFPKGESQAYDTGESVISVAASHVYGVGVQERDFMTPAADKIQKAARPKLAALAKIISTGGDPSQAEDILKSIADEGIGFIKASIVDGSYAPNSDIPMSDELREKVSKSWMEDIPKGMSYREAKLEFKGSDKPLVDTGHMIGAVTSVIRDRKE